MLRSQAFFCRLHRKRMYTEEKEKVVAVSWGMQQINLLFNLCVCKIAIARQGIESILSPQTEQLRPLPSLLSLSLFYDYGPLLLELEECGGGADEYLGLAEGDIGQQLPVLQQHLDTHHHHHQTKVRKP